MIPLEVLEIFNDLKEVYLNIFGSLWWWPIMMLIYVGLTALYRPQGRVTEPTQ